MFGVKGHRVWLASIWLMVIVGGVCLAQTVNINPHKIVLNAQGESDDVQANVGITLTSAQIPVCDVELFFGTKKVADAVSARYCLIDHILIIDFDRAELLTNEDVIAMANTTVIATVVGTVIDKNNVTGNINGSNTVQIVKPGKKGK